MINPKDYYLNIFGVTEPQMEMLAAEGLRHGGDFSDLFFENSSYTDLLLRDGAGSSGGFHVDYGVGIRVLSGERTGYAYSESTQPKAMMDAAAAASAIAFGGGEYSHARAR